MHISSYKIMFTSPLNPWEASLYRWGLYDATFDFSSNRSCVTISGSMATLDDFKKLDLRVAEIVDVEPHPNADRLYVLKLKVGDRQKQIVAGIKEFYSADELKGKRIAIIDNLEPVVLRGVESQGMLLAAKDENGLGVLTIERPVDSGSSIS